MSLLCLLSFFVGGGGEGEERAGLWLWLFIYIAFLSFEDGRCRYKYLVGSDGRDYVCEFVVNYR
jgi:hypothetical protein